MGANLQEDVGGAKAGYPAAIVMLAWAAPIAAAGCPPEQ
jgi:hypothetical protein